MLEKKYINGNGSTLVDDIEKNHEQIDAKLEQVIFKETLDLTYRAMPGSTSVTIIISILMTSVLWNFFESYILILWLSCVSLVNVCRYIAYKFYLKSSKSIKDNIFWDKVFYFLLILNGICFSTIGFFLLPNDDSIYHYFPEMILIGISAGAVSSLSFNMRNLTTYFMFLLLPIFLVEVIRGSFISYSAAVLVFLLALFSLINARRISQTSKNNITLQYKSKKHNQELLESKNIAIEANSAKSNFISMVSHELRTPLNGILGFAQLLKMSEQPVLNEEQSEQADGIIDSGGHLLSLIEELLDLSKIESHKLKVSIEAISLADTLMESISILKPVAADFNIKIISDIENKYLVMADRKRLKQIFINLISNAVKYNHEDGQVKISVASIEKDKIKISVSDTGDGLDEEQIKSLFMPFQRHHHEKEGLGLGLYITQNLVELMQGKIGVESKVKQGSTFWFDLPLMKDE